MTDPPNPWLPPEEDVADSPAIGITCRVAATGPEHPQSGVPTPDQVDQLPIRSHSVTAALWIVGVHGGSSESSVSNLDASWRAAGHAWPRADARGPIPVVVVARTSARGLTAAKAAAKQWGAGLVPDVRLLGLILVDDAPGRLPRPLRDLAQVVAGGYPRTWRIPWIEAWRLGEDVSSMLTAPREVRRVVEELHILLKDVHNTPSPDRKV